MSRRPKPRRAAKESGPSKNRLRDQERATEDVEAAERALAELEAELAAPQAWATRYEAAKSEARAHGGEDRRSRRPMPGSSR